MIVNNNSCSLSHASQVTHIVLQFKGQQSANTVRCQTSELPVSSKIGVQLSTIFTSPKLNNDLKPMEQNPALVNKQSNQPFPM